MIKLTTYGHALAIALIGIFIPLFADNLIGHFVSGIFIGTSLFIARKSGLEDRD